ncbi:MAG: hypothetical protein MUF61_02530 [archaeon]|jgi:hypothetical protein|nr:hypothetical protein [archaeon]
MGKEESNLMRIFFLSCIALMLVLIVGLNFSQITGLFVSCSEPENIIPFNASLNDFKVNGELMGISLVQGGSLEKLLSIKNTGRATIGVSAEASGLGDFLVIRDNKISILPGESGQIGLRFYALQSQKPGIYDGIIRIEGGGIVRNVNVIIEVRALKPLFDLSVKILPEYKEIGSGGKVVADVSMANLAKTEGTVGLRMQIADAGKNTIIDSSEEVLSNVGDISLRREFKTYGYLSSGKYILIARISYDNSSAEAYDEFDVVDSGFTFSSSWIYLILVAIILSELLLIFYIFYKWAVHFGILKTKIVHEMRVNEEKKKLRTRLKTVEQKFRKNKIAKPSYIKHKDRLIIELNKLDRLKGKVYFGKLSEERAEALSFKKYRLKSELKKLREGYRQGVISSEGYVKTRNGIEKQIEAINRKLGK